MKQVQNHNRSPICTVKFCINKHLARGYCSVHYTRWRTKGSPHAYSKNISNTYRIFNSCAKIDLRNNKGGIVGVTIVDRTDLLSIVKYRWCIDSSGYAIGRVEGTLMRLHSYLTRGGPHVDHKNRCKLDNRRTNLRIATPKQNAGNRTGLARTSRFKGVSLTRNKKWAVYAIFPDTHKRYWGSFNSELEAARAYNKAARKFGDSFTFINKLPTEGTL